MGKPFALRWRVGGQPALNGFTSDPEALGCAYTDNFDTRWLEQGLLGPLLTVVDCSGAAGTAANANSGDFTNGIDAAEKLVMSRGTQPAIIKLSTRLNVADASATVLGERCTQVKYVKNAAGTEEVCLMMAGTIFRVGTAFPDTGGYTHTANNESFILRYLGNPPSDNNATGQMYAVGRGTGTPENKVYTNILSGSVTMDASAFQEIAVISGEPFTFTGIVTDGDQIIPLTSNGPYYLNETFRQFMALIPELDNNTNNGLGAAVWSLLGTLIPLTRSLRLQRNTFAGQVGPEAFDNNNTPVQGRCTALWFSDRWGYAAFYNAVTTVTYICAFAKRAEGDGHNNPISWFTIATFAAELDCEFGIYAGTKGGVTSPTCYVGQDDDAAWFLEGRQPLFPSDTLMTYAASGTWFGTQFRGSQDALIQEIWFRTSGCTAPAATGENVTPVLAYVDHLGVDRTVTGPAMQTNGLHVWRLPNPIRASWFNPRMVLARGSTTTNTPKVLGDVILRGEWLAPRDSDGVGAQ